MAKDPQIMVTPNPPTGAPMGSRSDLIIRESFPNSPILSHEVTNLGITLTDDGITTSYQKLLDTYVVGGFGFSEPFYTEYYKNEPPDMSIIEAEPKGGPGMGRTIPQPGFPDGQPWPTTNVASSTGSPNGSGGYGVGANPLFQTSVISMNQTSVNFGSGAPEPKNPSVESKRISDQKFSSLILGKS